MTLVEGAKIKKYILILFHLQINQQNIASIPYFTDLIWTKIFECMILWFLTALNNDKYI